MHPGLAEALRAVLGVQYERGLSREWAIVRRALTHQARLQRVGQVTDDVVQVASYRILRSRNPFDGTEDRQAFKFLERVVHRVYLDMVDVTRRNDPMDYLMRPGGYDDRDPLDRVAAPDVDVTRSADAPAALEEVIDRLRDYVDDAIEAKDLRPLLRVSAQLHASATILAVLGKLGAREIARALGEPDANNARIYKWTERGRATIIEALDLWAKAGDEDDKMLLAELREQFLKRRKDAGRARPQRRKKERSRS